MCDKPGSFVVAYDGHVSQRRDQNKRIDRDVSDDVDNVVHQTAREVAEWPFGGGELVGGHRRNEDDECQVANGNVQQQQVRVRAHANTRHYDVDDEHVAKDAVAKDADKRYGTEQRRHDDAVQYVLEIFAMLGREQFVLFYTRLVPRLVSGDAANFRRRLR